MDIFDTSKTNKVMSNIIKIENRTFDIVEELVMCVNIFNNYFSGVGST